MHSNNLTVIPILYSLTPPWRPSIQGCLKASALSSPSAPIAVRCSLWGSCSTLKLLWGWRKTKHTARDIPGISGMYSTSCEHSEAKAPGAWRMNKCRYASWALFAFFEQGIYNSDCWNLYTFAWEIHLYQTLLACICGLAIINIQKQYADTSGEAESPFKVCTKRSTMAGPNSRTQPWRWMLNADFNFHVPNRRRPRLPKQSHKKQCTRNIASPICFSCIMAHQKSKHTAGPKIVLF